MKEPLAFRAAYSDWKLIRTRGVVQVVLEVPLADADAAYNVLGGMPDASRENWFAVAPLKLPPAEKEIKQNPSSEKEPATPQLAALDKSQPVGAKRVKPWRELHPSAQAYLLCEKPVFHAFLKEAYPDEWHESMTDAAECVRLICAVESRALLNDGAHRVIWHQLNEQYDLWALKERIGA